jgi:hypothetical protein
MFNRSAAKPVTETDMRQMLALLRHRGPDEFGILLDREAGLGNARLTTARFSITSNYARNSKHAATVSARPRTRRSSFISSKSSGRTASKK